MSVAIVSSARTMSLFCKVLAPPSPTGRPPQRLYAPPGYRSGLESLHARGKERDSPVGLGPPDDDRRRLGRAAAPGRGRIFLLPKRLEALRRTPPGLDRW